MEYPCIPQHVSKEKLFEYFSLTQDERYNLPQWRKEQNILGFAVLLKTYLFLGFPPRKKNGVPASVVSTKSQQLNIGPAEYERYRWKSRLWDIHLASIRAYTGFRPSNREDFQKLDNWLIDKARRHPIRSKMYAAAIQMCRHLRLELPREKELQRLINSTWQHYLSLVCRGISECIGSKIRIKMAHWLDRDSDNKNRYITFAAPGVTIWTPSAGGRRRFRSGTSFAALYFSAMAAIQITSPGMKQNPKTLLEIFRKSALDLGPPGKDTIYGLRLARCP